MVAPGAEWDLFRARLTTLLMTLNDVQVENLPADLERPQNPTRRDDESQITVDDALESCLRLLNDLRHKRIVDPVNAFFTLRNLSHQLVTLHLYFDAVQIHQHIVELLRRLRTFSGAFMSDLAINLATFAALLAVTGEFEKAKSTCREAIQQANLSPANDVPYNALAVALRVTVALEPSTEERAKLLLEAEKVYELLPDDSSKLHLLNRADILSVRGRTLIQEKKGLEAIAVLGEAVELYESMGATHPAHLKLALLRLADAHREHGQPEEANACLEHANRLNKEGEHGAPTPHRRASRFHFRRGTALVNDAAEGTGETAPKLLGQLFESPRPARPRPPGYQ
jgi:tetratricopeptide (TPR) repeat protein